MKQEFKTNFEIFKNVIRHNKYTKTMLRNKLNDSFANAEFTEDEKLELDLLIEKHGLDEEMEHKTVQEQIDEIKERTADIEMAIAEQYEGGK